MMGQGGRPGKLGGLASAALYANLAAMRGFVACVGLIVVLGCFTLVVAPDDRADPNLSTHRPTVVIDAGHGGNDGGAKSRNHLEKELTLRLANLLDARLKELGFATVMTRTEDRYVALSERVAAVNAIAEPALLVSLHFNRGEAAYINGVETYYCEDKHAPPRGWRWIGFFNPPEDVDTGEALAGEVQQAIVAKTGARDRGIRPARFYVTRHTWSPAILVEGGFLSNRMESTLLANADYLGRMADGIAKGVATWYERQADPFAPPHPGQLARAENAD